ncbi:hypothetical protein [Methylocapsa palsarum]|uniref:Uncharacterized protein n=1 Tax=Methylocapsa palsarum TaxID=1612308 RepID=A0A1I3XQW1_9HYPH|nr:hypothetical protein [Methylocapsa palsarum]SFK21920.1 hypothetical protein SAMN05444581_10418 [Methylocapsa palsarum]
MNIYEEYRRPVLLFILITIGFIVWLKCKLLLIVSGSSNEKQRAEAIEEVAILYLQRLRKQKPRLPLEFWIVEGHVKDKRKLNRQSTPTKFWIFNNIRELMEHLEEDIRLPIRLDPIKKSEGAKQIYIFSMADYKRIQSIKYSPFLVQEYERASGLPSFIADSRSPELRRQAVTGPRISGRGRDADLHLSH